MNFFAGIAAMPDSAELLEGRLADGPPAELERRHGGDASPSSHPGGGFVPALGSGRQATQGSREEEVPCDTVR
jgi:hypothetical protein